MVELSGCPFCGKEPRLEKGERDRDLHPSVPRLRYKCAYAYDGHQAVGPWVESPYLGWDHDNPELIEMAADAWNGRVADV